MESSHKPSSPVDLKTLIHSHSLFLDNLVELIPARFYLPVDDKDKPYFQGLSKAAKASAKKESKENLKKARRARLDPDNKSSTTLDLLKKSLEPDKPQEGNPSEDSEKDAEIENPGYVISDERSVTYEELRQRLHRRIEELRSNRNTRPPIRGRIERDDKKKRKRDAGSEEEQKKEKKKAKPAKGGDGVSADIAFGQVKVGDEDGMNRKKRKLSKLQALEKAKRLKEAKMDPDKGEVVSKKHSWSAAASRAAGVKIHDDPKLLDKSIKKEKKRHQKHTEKWKERVESRDKIRADKQKTRTDNIKGRIQQKKTRRIEKREKKLMRPGFEGRKEGYINAT